MCAEEMWDDQKPIAKIELVELFFAQDKRKRAQRVTAVRRQREVGEGRTELKRSGKVVGKKEQY